MNVALGIIGGTGIGETFAARPDVQRVECDTPFGAPSAPVLRASVNGMTCLFLSRHGTGHLLNPSTVPYRANIFALKKLGATHVIATGATGSLQEHIEPGHLVICDQVIDKTHKRDATFFDAGLVGHAELADPFCPQLRQTLVETARFVDDTVHASGTYVCMEGPQFSTRAESLMHRSWGGDLIGMTCMPEAKLAREAELCYALIALPTDYDCWKPHDPAAGKQALLQEIIANMRRASDAAASLIEKAITRLSQNPPTHCPCQDALELAIWSDKASVSPAIVDRLRPLIGRYFDRQT